MFKFTRSGIQRPGRRGFGAAMGVVLAVILMLPGVSGALTSGEEHAETSYSIGEVAATIGADELYADGLTGQGVTVAVIDTGVASIEGLDGDKVIYGPDLSFEAGVEELYNQDTYGHGTAMASIIAGNDGIEGGFRGIAPGARILAVKVADNTGAVDVSQVIAALDFVVETKDETGVRVINLSYRTDGGSDVSTDPLIAAVERAWDAGIVVVVSAGNDGVAGLGNPALSPYVIAVAASEEAAAGTADFSNVGAGERAPDLTAPGSRLLSLAAPGSRLVQENPSAVLEGGFLRGSGTSQAAAVVSGAAALLIEARPQLTPDAIKAQLILGTNKKIDGSQFRLSTRALRKVDASWDDNWSGRALGPIKYNKKGGAGYLNVDRASKINTSMLVQAHPRSDGTGSLDDARGSTFVTLPDGTTLSGDVTFTGSSWSGSSWSGSSWSGSSWSGSSWSGSSWSGSSWSGSSWSGSSWSGSSWSGSSWSGSSWSGSSWSGSSWSGVSWS